MEILSGSFLTTHIPDEDEKDHMELTIDGCYDKYPPCGDHKYETCFDCPKFDMDECKIGYNLSRYVIHCK